MMVAAKIGLTQWTTLFGFHNSLLRQKFPFAQLPNPTIPSFWARIFCCWRQTSLRLNNIGGGGGGNDNNNSLPEMCSRKRYSSDPCSTFNRNRYELTSKGYRTTIIEPIVSLHTNASALVCVQTLPVYL